MFDKQPYNMHSSFYQHCYIICAQYLRVVSVGIHGLSDPSCGSEEKCTDVLVQFFHFQSSLGDIKLQFKVE